MPFGMVPFMIQSIILFDDMDSNEGMVRYGEIGVKCWY